MILPIRVLGDPILRRRATPLASITDDTRRLVDDMFETMYAAKGIGLAAPQVGVSEHVFITDVDGARYTFINPEIVSTGGESFASEEGCLSIPEIFADVTRPDQVTLRGLSIEGEPITLTATQLLGRCLQHEFDHLEGKLFVDYLSFLKRRRAMAEWARMESEFPGFVRILTPGDPGDPDHPDSERL
jgi:peptide deformylase